MCSFHISRLRFLFLLTPLQLANIYITVTAGSIWTAFSAIVDHPGAVFEILGRSLPTMVGFFVSLLMTKTLVSIIRIKSIISDSYHNTPLQTSL